MDASANYRWMESIALKTKKRDRIPLLLVFPSHDIVCLTSLVEIDTNMDKLVIIFTWRSLQEESLRESSTLVETAFVRQQVLVFGFDRGKLLEHNWKRFDVFNKNHRRRWWSINERESDHLAYACTRSLTVMAKCLQPFSSFLLHRHLSGVNQFEFIILVVTWSSSMNNQSKSSIRSLRAPIENFVFCLRKSNPKSNGIGFLWTRVCGLEIRWDSVLFVLYLWMISKHLHEICELTHWKSFSTGENPHHASAIYRESNSQVSFSIASLHGTYPVMWTFQPRRTS